MAKKLSILHTIGVQVARFEASALRLAMGCSLTRVNEEFRSSESLQPSFVRCGPQAGVASGDKVCHCACWNSSHWRKAQSNEEHVLVCCHAFADGRKRKGQPATGRYRKAAAERWGIRQTYRQTDRERGLDGWMNGWMDG